MRPPFLPRVNGSRRCGLLVGTGGWHEALGCLGSNVQSATDFLCELELNFFETQFLCQSSGTNKQLLSSVEVRYFRLPAYGDIERRVFSLSNTSGAR